MKSIVNLKIILIISISLLNGCSALVPYEDEFACKRPDNMGKCISTEDAYKELRTGNDVAPYAKPASQQEDDVEVDEKEVSNQNKVKFSILPDSGYDQYIDANYKETAKLLKEGVTPILSSGDTIKIVLAPNRLSERILISERIMYVIIEEPKFIMGNYLIKKHIPATTLFGD